MAYCTASFCHFPYNTQQTIVATVPKPPHSIRERNVISCPEPQFNPNPALYGQDNGTPHIYPPVSLTPEPVDQISGFHILMKGER